MSAVLESTERFPGAPRSPEIDRTRAKVRDLWELPQAAPVVLNVTRRDPYLELALLELMCLAFASGANDALHRVRT